MGLSESEIFQRYVANYREKLFYRVVIRVE